MVRSLDATLDALAELPDQVRALRAEVAELRRLLEAAKPDRLLPLATILGCSAKAASNRLSRDPELRALGHRLGRRMVFRSVEVEQLLADRQRARAGLNGGA